VTTYTKWLGGQPDNANNNEDVAVMDWPEHGLWIDISTAFTGAATMCERQITAPLTSTYCLGNESARGNGAGSVTRLGEISPFGRNFYQKKSPKIHLNKF
jgi:hypothetical protein